MWQVPGGGSLLQRQGKLRGRCTGVGIRTGRWNGAGSQGTAGSGTREGAQDKGLHVRDAGDDWVSGDPRWEL